jgi:hypothetical protein
MMTRVPTKLVAVAVTLALSTACQSRITGNEGNFQFAYPADDAFVDFNKAVAVGASLDLAVTDVDEGKPVTLSSAQFGEPDLLNVTGFEGNTITLQGVADGNSLLEVVGTTAAGETLTDSVNMRAATPDTIELRHTCHSEDTAYYLTGQRVWVPFELKLGRSPAIGYGYYPVDFSDPSLATFAADKNQQYMPLDLGSAVGDLVLTSQLAQGDPLTMRIVGPEYIDGATEPIAFVLEDIDVGDTNAFYVLPRVGSTPICQADVTKTVTSDTPDICDVRDRDNPTLGGDQANEFGWFEVEGKAVGTCLYTVAYPEGDNGSGASQQFSFEIQP